MKERKRNITRTEKKTALIFKTPLPGLDAI
jgi:hypothetical protein